MANIQGQICTKANTMRNCAVADTMAVDIRVNIIVVYAKANIMAV